MQERLFKVLSPLLLFIIWTIFTELSAQRNAKEEAICAPFLTSPNSSPLIPLSQLPRNLKFDEDAEFSCELVLQDRFLPAQIRLVIHEGLYHLAVRHISMGLHRERTALRHATALSEMIPAKHQFRHFVGTWALNPEVYRPDLAITHLYECVHGNASKDSNVTKEEDYKARRDYIKALGYVRRYSDARTELSELLKRYPLDFEAEYLSESKSQYLDQLRSAVSSIPGECRSMPSQHQIIDHLVSKEELLSFVHQRQPLLFSLGSVQKLDEALNWQVSKWVDKSGYSYFLSTINEKESVVAECALRGLHSDTTSSDPSATKYGFSLASSRRVKRMEQILRGGFQDEECLYYINVQDTGSGLGFHRAPLHLLKDDFPLKDVSIFDAIKDNLTDINLWMSVNSGSVPSVSRLHRDPTDNLYFVLEGKKEFALWSPELFASMNTISPSYTTNDYGLSYQFNIVRFRNYVRSKLLSSQMSSEANSTDSLGSDIFSNHLLAELLSNDVPYEMDNIHFSASSLDSLPPPSSVVTLAAGDVLYLPAGWFHQVSSFPGKHMAINFWWRPLNWEQAVDMESKNSEILFEQLLKTILKR